MVVMTRDSVQAEEGSGGESMRGRHGEMPRAADVADASSKSDAVGPTSPGRLGRDLLERLKTMGVVRGVANVGQARPPARPDVTPIEQALPGTVVENAFGTCYVSDARFSVTEEHGGVVLGAVRQADRRGLAVLGGAPELTEIDWDHAAFLDTETTGLGIGAGTYAFLIGIGRYVGTSFQVRQLFMRDPSEERAQLAEAADWVADCSALVTFNGRTFDMPLLEARYTLNRLPVPLGEATHLDLLPLSRRMWRRRVGSCALTSLERSILGFERQDDVPGWLIPYRYLTYQRDGDARPLVGIFKHNVLDILSMVALTSRADRFAGVPHDVLKHGIDWLSLAHVHSSAGDHDEVVSACEGALNTDLSDAERAAAMRLLSLGAKRRGDWKLATETWWAMLSEHSTRSLFAFEELAKYYEHRVDPPDFERALDLATRARQLVASGDIEPHVGRDRALAGLDHRIARLQRRMKRERAAL